MMIMILQHNGTMSTSPYDTEIRCKTVRNITNYDPPEDKNTNVMKPIDNSKDKDNDNESKKDKNNKEQMILKIHDVVL